MKTIGLIGGLSWESTTDYYRYINQGVKAELGGLSSAKCMLYSCNFEEVVRMQKAGEWKQAAMLLADAARKLEAGGCDTILICTNTMHVVASEVQQAVRIPLLHIVDTTVESIKRTGISKVGLLGTRYTMEQSFYTDRLCEHGIEAIIPDETDRIRVHDIIFDELCKGELKPASKAEYLRIIDRLRARGAEGVILGCTEIPLLLKQEDVTVPMFDTTRIHADAAVAFALEAVAIS
ncbi:aspartate/glutamate racemase family protein [Paenibacillus sp. LHD-117]|uniref:aspartate/glutamate racemase family protein n=1 Tax=Paenibacillus sp. LHD-117 TaxID=3071412 RepID=UPI0027E065AB|nr:aspartate/glutamate racemase family protein [Paenibacillus sp. LHD-117]MDQ6423614.1 aspartate/glutamate racemase family protein [Paenibacillus sp. LHD-117]